MNTEVVGLGFCYVVPKISTYHPIADVRNDLAYYPEEDMSLFETVNFKRYEKSIVTENPFIISCYPMENVRVWNEKRGWSEPRFETYGCSVNKILSSLLSVKQTIPGTVLDSGEAMRKVEEKLVNIYKEAQQLTMVVTPFDDEMGGGMDISTLRP